MAIYLITSAMAGAFAYAITHICYIVKNKGHVLLPKLSIIVYTSRNDIYTIKM